MIAGLTPYSDVNELLALLLSRLQTILGNKLVGLYLFGSLVVGDFDEDSSDIDLLAAIASELDEAEFEVLDHMHSDIQSGYKKWEGRLEIGYIGAEHLKQATSRPAIALISPGEPFHMKVAETDWIINRALLYDKGVALYGPAPRAMFVPLTREECLRADQQNTKEWRAWITHTEMIHERVSQAYMILTMCRKLYSFWHDGAVVSKKQAAEWAAREWPEWAALIRNAMAWRAAWREEQVDHDATLPETLQFVRFALDQIDPA